MMSIMTYRNLNQSQSQQNIKEGSNRSLSTVRQFPNKNLDLKVGTQRTDIGMTKADKIKAGLNSKQMRSLSRLGDKQYKWKQEIDELEHLY